MNEEDDAEGDQRLGMERLGRLVELVGDDAREGESRGEDRAGDLRRIADHEGDRDRLADRPAESEDHRREKAGPPDRDDDIADDIPAGPAEREDRLALQARASPRRPRGSPRR